jgi:hypothetical protein
VGQQTNLPEDLPALSRDQEKHKAGSKSGVAGQLPKAGQGVDPRANLWDKGQHSKLNCPNLLGQKLTKKSYSWHLVKAAALTTLHELAVLPHLTIPTNHVDRRTKYQPSQASHLMSTHQHFLLYTNTRIGHLSNNSWNFTNKLNFLWFLNMIFLLCSFFFHFLVSLTSSSLFSYPCSYTLSPVLQFILISPNYSFCPSHPLFALSSPLPPILPKLSPQYSSLLHTNHLLTSLLYQLYAIPAPCNPWQKQLTLQQKYTQTHTRATKPISPIPLFPTDPQLHPPFQWHLHQFPNIYN